MVQSKLRLIIRKPQSGKTFICIKDIETTPIDLHIVMTMNTIKSNKQFVGRLIEKLGGDNIIIYNSDKDYEIGEDGTSIEDDCFHCHTSTDVIEHIRKHTIKVIIMCSHRIRWSSSVHEIVSHLSDSKAFGTRQISVHSDEAHEYINKKRTNIELLINNNIVRQFRMYSATPFPIWKDGANINPIWNKIYIINVEDMYKLVKHNKYFGVKDCNFISSDICDVDYTRIHVPTEIVMLANSQNKTPRWIGKDRVFDLGDEIKYLQYIKTILPILKLNEHSFSYNFIPSYKRKITQYQIMRIIHEIYPTSNVIIMNGNETGMTLFRLNRCIDSNTKISEPSEQIEELLHRYNYVNYPTFIVGFQTCNMSVTLINKSIGNFDNMIFYHDHLKNDPECLYQMMRVVFSYINWDMFDCFKIKKTNLYCDRSVYKIICSYENAVEKIEQLEEGEYLQDEIRGTVPIKKNKKKEKKENFLQQIPKNYLDHDIQAISINNKNQSRKWKQIEDEYLEFYGKSINNSKISDPRCKKTSCNNFILCCAMGGKYKQTHVDKDTLSKYLDGLSWYSNFAIKKDKYKYIRLYVGYKNIDNHEDYTVYIRTVELENNDIVNRLLAEYDNKP